MIPLIDSGLYGPGQNDMPPDLLARGLAAASLITKRLPDGTPGTGRTAKMVVLAVGMSNWNQELRTFLSLYRRSPEQGGFGGSKYPTWHNACRGAWDARRMVEHWPEYEAWLRGGLAKKNITLPQISVLLLKNSIARQAVPVTKLADYHTFVIDKLANLCPNLQQVYITTAGWSGFGIPSAPRLEPWAWEEGRVAQELILQRAEAAAEPWTAFGPYIWANGPQPRSFDGLFYVPADFEVKDYVHPGPGAEAKIARQIWDFFSKPNRSPAAEWFRR